jgi:callose synthase
MHKLHTKNIVRIKASIVLTLLYPVKEIYRIKLPGPAKLGEGKPENQNHAIIFTRGEALQTIDMNQVKWVVMVDVMIYISVFVVLMNNLQDNYLEEALKMRNLLEEFNENHGVRQPTILGVREHIFTGRYVL